MAGPYHKKLSNSQIFHDSFDAAKTRSEKEAKQRRQAHLRTAQRLVNDHIATLAFKYRQSVQYDEYGKTSFDYKRWERERDKFLSSVVTAEIGNWVTALRFDIAEMIEDAAKAAQVSLSKDISKLTPVEFEMHCANLLRTIGWQASITTRSGDQGVDVIAQKNGVSVVLQCKLYSKPVGNDAVQEAIAGRAYVRTTHAAVVTNSTFTKAARNLATAAGVLLLHVTELPSLELKITGLGN